MLIIFKTYNNTNTYSEIEILKITLVTLRNFNSYFKHHIKLLINLYIFNI